MINICRMLRNIGASQLTAAIYTILLIAVMCVHCLHTSENDNDTQYSTAAANSDNEQRNLEPLERNQNCITITMIAAGDAILHEAVYVDGMHKIQIVDEKTKTQQTKIAYDFNSMLEMIKPIVQKHDLAYYNQETILGGTKLGLSTYPTFNSPQEFGDAMIQAGFNMVSLANNHSLDKGEKGIRESIKYWTKNGETHGIVTAGCYESQKDKDDIKIYNKNGITYAFLSYTYGTNGIIIPHNKKYLVNTYTKDVLEQDIKNIRDKVDLLIVAMHWGHEHTFEPNKNQRDMAQLLSNLGVDIVIGNHPHVIQPIEIINDCLVMYSLGNMISNQDGLHCKIGMMVSCSIQKNTINNNNVYHEEQCSRKTKAITIDNINVHFIYTYRDENQQNFKIIPFNRLNDEILPFAESIKKEYIAKINLHKNDNITIQ